MTLAIESDSAAFVCGGCDVLNDFPEPSFLLSCTPQSLYSSQDQHGVSFMR